MKHFVDFYFTDDIIKLNKKELKASRAGNIAKTKRAAHRNNVLKKLHQVPQQQRGLRRGAQQYRGKLLMLKTLLSLTFMTADTFGLCGLLPGLICFKNASSELYKHL